MESDGWQGVTRLVLTRVRHLANSVTGAMQMDLQLSSLNFRSDMFRKDHA